MADGELFCPKCLTLVPVMWLGNRLVYRPHNNPEGGRCSNSRKPAEE